MTTRWTCWLIGFTFFVCALSADAGEKTLVSKRTLAEIKETLGTILTADAKKADANTLGLRKLKAYRYLAEVPFDDVKLDDDYNKACAAGAKLCLKIGKLEHRPENPGLPEDEFKLAFKGTSQSNLAQGFRSPVQAVDAWMDDSDGNNIDRLGHRRWCLNPTMAKTGFGQAGDYVAMYSFDRTRKKVPDYDMICFPARGVMPIEFFGTRHAWNVSLNPKKYKAPDKDFEPKIYEADETGAKQGEPLKLDHKGVNTGGFGVPNCVIFRPAKLKLKSGSRYVVELEGIRPQVGKALTLRYVVVFEKWK